MIEQLKTIRSDLSNLMHLGAVQRVIDTINQLEAMVGGPDPDVVIRDDAPTLLLGSRVKDTDVRLYRAAPVAQQPLTALEQYDLDQSPEYRKGWDAGRVKGYEVGYRHATEHAAPVAQQPVGEMVAWPDDHQRVGVEWSDGMPEIGTKLFAAPVAQQPWPDRDKCAHGVWVWDDCEKCSQQPQAEPLTDEQRLGWYAWRVKDLEEKLANAHKQPQAEAVPSSDLNPDEGDPVTLWAEIWRLREAVKGPDGYATWQDAATAERIRRVRAESKQTEEAKAAPTHDDTDLIEQMLEALRSCSGVSHWPALIPTINAARKRLETPQQAEAVPPGYVLVPVEPTEAMLRRGAPENSPYGINYAEACYRAMIAAAIAQQKGGA